MGRPALAILLSLLRQVLVLLPLIILFPHLWGLTAIWAAAPVSDTVALIVAAFAVLAELRHLKRLQTAGRA